MRKFTPPYKNYQTKKKRKMVLCLMKETSLMTLKINALSYQKKLSSLNRRGF